MSSQAYIVVQYGTQQARIELPSRSVTVGDVMHDFFKAKGLDEYVEIDEFAARLFLGEVFFNRLQPISDVLDCAWAFREDPNDELADILLLVRKPDVGDAAQRASLRIDASGPSLYSGYLWKKGGSAMTPYKRRWFCFQGATLYYQEDENSTNALGYIPMGGCEVIPKPGSSNRNFSHYFELTGGTAGKRDYALGAESEEELKRFTDAVDLFNQRRAKSIVVAAIMELRRRGFASMNGIFRVSGDKSAVDAIKVAYDKTEFPKLEEIKDDNVLAGVVKMTLRDMRYPVVPFALYNDFVDAGRAMDADRPETAKQAVAKLPYQNMVFLKYLCSVFKEVAQYEATTQMTPKNLAIVISPNIIRTQTDSAQTMTETSYIHNTIEAMITHYDVVFPYVKGETGSAADFPPPPPPPPQPSHLAVGVNVFGGLSKEAAAAAAALVKAGTSKAGSSAASETGSGGAGPASPGANVTTPNLPPPVARAPSASVSVVSHPPATRPAPQPPLSPPAQPPQPPQAQPPKAPQLAQPKPPEANAEIAPSQCDLKQTEASTIAPVQASPAPVVTQETLNQAVATCDSVVAQLTTALNTYTSLAKQIQTIASSYQSQDSSLAADISKNISLHSAITTVLSEAKVLSAALSSSSTSLNVPTSVGPAPAVIQNIAADVQSKVAPSTSPALSATTAGPLRRPLPNLPPLPALPARPQPQVALPAAPAPVAPTVKLLGVATALYDYPGGSRAGDVPFSRGARLYIESKEPTDDPNSAGWYKAYIQDPAQASNGSAAAYWVPANYVQMN